MNRKLIPVFLIALLVIAAVLIKIFFFKSEFRYVGTIEATKVDLSSRVTSVISSFDVKEGDKVEKDRVLIRLACEDYRLASDLAAQNFERASRLYREGSQAKEAFDLAKNTRDTAALKVSWCDVAAPRAGRILATYREAGEMVSPGTKFLTLADLRDVYAYIYVAQPEVARVKLDQTLPAFLPEIQREIPGRIAVIGAEAEFTPKNVQTREERQRLVYAVKVSFPNEDEVLKPGMAIEVRLPE